MGAVLGMGVVFAAGCGSRKTGYPSGTVTVIASQPAGGSSDRILRMIQPFLQRELGVPVATENLPAGRGIEGIGRVHRARPDGYTLLFGSATEEIARQVRGRIPDGYADLTPVYNVAGVDSTLLFVKAESPLQSFAHWVSAAKSRELSLAWTEEGSVSLIGIGWLVRVAGIPRENLKTVSLAAEAAVAQEVSAGRVEAGLSGPDAVLGRVRDGSVRVLVSFGKDRSPLLADVPTFREVHGGESNYYELFQGFLGPPDMPPAPIWRLNEALDRVVGDAAFQEQAKSLFRLAPMQNGRFAAELIAFDSLARQMRPFLRVVESERPRNRE